MTFVRVLAGEFSTAISTSFEIMNIANEIVNLVREVRSHRPGNSEVIGECESDRVFINASCRLV